MGLKRNKTFRRSRLHIGSSLLHRAYRWVLPCSVCRSILCRALHLICSTCDSSMATEGAENCIFLLSQAKACALHVRMTRRAILGSAEYCYVMQLSRIPLFKVTQQLSCNANKPETAQALMPRATSWLCFTCGGVGTATRTHPQCHWQLPVPTTWRSRSWLVLAPWPFGACWGDEHGR